jgi:hypothetical protein
MRCEIKSNLASWRQSHDVLPRRQRLNGAVSNTTAYTDKLLSRNPSFHRESVPMLTKKLTTSGQNDAPDRSPVTVYHRPRTRPTSAERTSTDQSLESTDVSYIIRIPTHLNSTNTQQPLDCPRCPIYTPLQPDVNMAGRADGSRDPKVRAPISRDEAIYRNRHTPSVAIQWAAFQKTFDG